MKSILITGAGSGLGKGAAIGLAKEGHKIIAGVQNMEQFIELKRETEIMNISLEIVKLDVTNKEDINGIEKYDIDILVNNAGINEAGIICEQDIESVRRIFDVNVFGNLALTQTVVKKMVQTNKKGKIIWVSSISGVYAGLFAGAYSGSKFAIEAIAEAMYKELLPQGIQVAVINPGPYKTGLNDRMIENFLAGYNPDVSFVEKKVVDEAVSSYVQYDPEEMIKEMVRIIPLEHHKYRTMKPENWEEFVREEQKKLWELEI